MISPDQIREWNNSLDFNPRDLELTGEKNTRARETIVNAIKDTTNVSDSNLIRNPDCLLSKMEVESEVHWVDENKKQVNKTFKMTC